MAYQLPSTDPEVVAAEHAQIYEQAHLDHLTIYKEAAAFRAEVYAEQTTRCEQKYGTGSGMHKWAIEEENAGIERADNMVLDHEHRYNL